MGLHDALHPRGSARPQARGASDPRDRGGEEQQGEDDDVWSVVRRHGSAAQLAVCGAAGGESDGERVVLFADWEGW